jgi:DNA-binding transcriptional ArsR family regulator
MTVSIESKLLAMPKPTASPTEFRRLADQIKGVSDLTRLRVLLLLGDRERNVGNLCSEISCSMTALSCHLALMRLAGLIAFRQQGQRHLYALTESGREIRRVIVAVIG